MPVFAKPITQHKIKHLNRHADLRSSYPNGTVIGYHCESAYTLVTGDLEERTCVNGKWVGKVGKCGQFSIYIKSDLKTENYFYSNQFGKQIAVEFNYCFSFGAW